MKKVCNGRVAHPKVKPIVLRSDGSIAPEEFTEEELAFFQGWQPVTAMIDKDIEESLRAGQAIRAIPKRCWQNARRVVQMLDDYADASYVEGILCPTGFHPIEHAWVVRSDGYVIDPTLPRDGGSYIAGLEFRGRAGIEEFLATARGSSCRQSPFFYAFGWCGRKSPSIDEAWRLAEAYLRDQYPQAFKDQKQEDAK